MSLNHSVYTYDTTSFSGADTSIFGKFDYSGNTRQIINIQTLSYSIHTDTDHVRALGHKLAKDFSDGQMVLAGTIVFTMLGTEVLNNFIQEYRASISGALGIPVNNLYIRADQLPPMEILIVQTNDYGKVIKKKIGGVKFVNEGQIYSVHDLITENTVNYFAKSIKTINSVNIEQNASNNRIPQRYDDR